MYLGFFFFKQKTAYEIASCLVGSEMCIRDSEAQISTILEEVKGLKNISQIKQRGIRPVIHQVLDNNGMNCDDGQNIGEIFASFYSDLYAARSKPVADENKIKTTECQQILALHKKKFTEISET